MDYEIFTWSRVIHVLAVLFWIGGVSFVTLVIMPTVRKNHPPEERLAAFHRIEESFAPQARVWVILAGASGFWMMYEADLWGRFSSLDFWWMHAMLMVWLMFCMMLFVIEPLFLHKRMANSSTPAEDFAAMERAHWFLLALSVIAMGGAVGGAHGLF